MPIIIKPMKLADLAHALKLAPPTHNPDITGVTHNAAWVRPQDLFVAIRGAKVDGHSFVAQAQERGAVAVAGEGWPYAEACPLPYLTVENARAALADIAAELQGHPSRELKVVGVTGTDGKTTTSWLTLHLLRSAGLAAGLLSTVGYQLSDGVLRHFPAHFTTPEAPQVQETLRELVAGGAAAVVLEASSHALALERVRAVAWDVAIWTHLSREHLDFHGTVEDYFAEKRKLIERSPFAVLNADDVWTQELLGLGEHTTYSTEGHIIQGKAADWQALHIQEGAEGLSFTVCSPLGEFEAHLPMIGRFNVANALAACGAAARLGASVQQLQAGLSTFGGVAGRMERVLVEGVVGRSDQPRVIVDFAHTPPSLEKVLETLRATTQGKLWVVIGSAGGPRDPSKRAPLGEVATLYADHAIFTEEDHRDTPLQDILDEMERGAREAGRANFVSIGDRREAIRYAITHAQAGDTVLLAGKGPEDTLERDTETLEWNEVEEARAALAQR